MVTTRHSTRPATRQATTLAEVLVALVILAIASAWTLSVAAAAEHALGSVAYQRAMLRRGARALADLDALPCDSINIVYTVIEPRWQLRSERDHDGAQWHDVITLAGARGDSLRFHRGGTC